MGALGWGVPGGISAVLERRGIGGSCKPELGGQGRLHKDDVMCEQRPGGGERVRHKGAMTLIAVSQVLLSVCYLPGRQVLGEECSRE